MSRQEAAASRRKGREIRRLPAEVIYDPEAASLYIQLKKRVVWSRAIDRAPRGDGRDITLIIMDYDASGGLSGIEILLNPSSQLKLALDDDLGRKTPPNKP